LLLISPRRFSRLHFAPRLVRRKELAALELADTAFDFRFDLVPVLAKPQVLGPEDFARARSRHRQFDMRPIRSPRLLLFMFRAERDRHEHILSPFY
jgi:hypothetical protein